MSDMDDVEAFARATRMKVAIRIGIVIAIFSAPFGYLFYSCHKKQQRIAAREEAYRKSLELTDAERAGLKQRIDETRVRVAKAREGWKTSVTPDALAQLQPGENPCSARYTAPTAGAGDSYVKYGSIDANYFGNAWAWRYKAGEPIPVPYGDTLQATVDVEKKLADGSADRNDLNRIRDFDDRIVFVIADEETAPIVTAGSVGISSFLPGRVVGRAYVYSASQQRIICMTDIDVQNGDSVEFDYSYMQGNYLDKEMKMREAGRATLARDLEVRIRQAIASQLRAVTGS